jgi:hypothetical protein
VKGVTPSKPELMSALEDEENADATLGNDDDDEEEEEEEEIPLPEDEAAAIPVETAKASYVGDKWVSPQGGEEEEGGGSRSSNKGIWRSRGRRERLYYERERTPSTSKLEELDPTFKKRCKKLARLHRSLPLLHRTQLMNQGRNCKILDGMWAKTSKKLSKKERS